MPTVKTTSPPILRDNRQMKSGRYWKRTEVVGALGSAGLRPSSVAVYPGI
jgi:hypothetical protein